MHSLPDSTQRAQRGFSPLHRRCLFLQDKHARGLGLVTVPTDDDAINSETSSNAGLTMPEMMVA